MDMDSIGAAATRLYDDDVVAETSVAKSRQDFAEIPYEQVEIRTDEVDGIIWCDMTPSGRPCFTDALITDFQDLQRRINHASRSRNDNSIASFNYFVAGSKTPGIYNLGGDLGYFVDRIRARDIEAMRRYAYRCVEGQYENSCAFGAPMITMALVRGDALGGGFEFALSFDMIVAERSARLGLPEVLFNLFPGMGAYSFISRRLDRRRAEEFILSGTVYTAEELHAIGLIDVLAEDGCGEQAVRDYVAQHRRRFNMERATYEARRRVDPVTLAELRSVVELWAETAMNLSERDLKVMLRLAAAQDRRIESVGAAMRVV